MTRVEFTEDRLHRIRGFESRGHSGYAEEGEDIVCAGISVLIFNTLNSIEALTDAQMNCEKDPENALIRFSSEDYDQADVQLLLQSLFLGLNSIKASYGSSFIEVIMKEV